MLCGVPVRRIVEGDEVERALWLRVTRRAAELRVQLIRAEAAYIGNEIARRFR